MPEIVEQRVIWGTGITSDTGNISAIFGQHLFGQVTFGQMASGRGGGLVAGGGAITSLANGADAVINREVEDWTGEYRSSDMSFVLADVNREIYGSFYTNLRPLGIYLEYQTKQTGSTWQGRWRGRISSVEWQDGALTLNAFDEMKYLKEAGFVYDKSFIGQFTSKDSAGTSYFMESGTSLANIENGSLSPDPVYADLFINEAGITESENLFKVSSGTIIGTIATFTFGEDPKIGLPANVYVKVPIYISGNPGQAVYDLLTGNNGSNTYQFQDSQINKVLFGEGTRVTANNVIEGTIYKSGSRVLYETLKEISKPVQANMWIQDNGKFAWSAYRPYHPDNVPLGTLGTSDVFNVKVGETDENYFNIINVSFDKGFLEAARLIDYRGNTKKLYREYDTRFNGLRREHEEILSPFTRNPEEAVVTRDRYGIKYSDGQIDYTWDTPMLHRMALDANLDDQFQLSHDAGTAVTRNIRITAYSKHVGDGFVSVQGFDSTEQFKGYGYWEDSIISAEERDIGTFVTANNMTAGCWYDSGTGFVTNYHIDSGGTGIFVYRTLDGTTISTVVTGPANLSQISDMEFDKNGTMYAYQIGTNGTIIKYKDFATSIGEFIVDSTHEMMGVATDLDDNVWLFSDGGTIYQYTTEGTHKREFYISQLNGISIESAFVYGSYGYAADRTNGSIQVVSLIAGSYEKAINSNLSTDLFKVFQKGQDAEWYQVASSNKNHYRRSIYATKDVNEKSMSGWGSMVIGSIGTSIDAGSLQLSGHIDGNNEFSADIVAGVGANFSGNYFTIDNEEVLIIDGGLTGKISGSRFQFNTGNGSFGSTFGSGLWLNWVGTTREMAINNIYGTVPNLSRTGTWTRWF